MGQLDLSHTARAESLGEDVVPENTIGRALLGRFEPGGALRMSLHQGKGLFNRLAWGFTKVGCKVGWGVAGKDHKEGGTFGAAFSHTDTARHTWYSTVRVVKA